MSTNQISLSDFTGTFQLGIGASSPQETYLNEIITEVQPDILKAVLGDIEYAKFIADLDGNGDPQTAKWTNFVDGTTLSSLGDDSRTMIYTGIKAALKGFVFYTYLRYNTKINTNIGTVTKKTQNSIIVDESDRMAQKYNYGVEHLGRDWKNEFTENQIGRVINQTQLLTSEADKYKDNAYNYLYWMNETLSTNFPDWIFTPVSNINSMNL